MILAFDDTGSGPPVVLLHAFPLSRAMWRPQREGLADACRLITPDLPGFGDSPPGDAATVEGMADAVAATLDAAGVGGPVVLGGLSMGGYVCFAFTRKYPDRLAGLILADTRAEPDDAAARANRDRLIALAAASACPAAAIVEEMLPKLLGPASHAGQPGLVARVREIGAAQSAAGLVGALRGLRDRPDSTPTLGQVRVPTLLLVGGDDALTPPTCAEGMAARIAGARLVVIARAGHLSSLEQPAAFNDAVRAFVRSLRP